MPTYKYLCTHMRCGHKFEVEQRITDATLAVCPECNYQTNKRLIGRPTFILRGPGWAKDNYSPRGTDPTST